MQKKPGVQKTRVKVGSFYPTSVSWECELHLLKTRDVVHFGAIIDDNLGDEF